MKQHNVIAISRTPPAFARICALMLCLMIGAAPCRAACPAETVSLYMPAPAGSQLDALYGLLPETWRAHFQETLNLSPFPGRGGSHAIRRLLDDEGSGCSLAAVILPSLYLLTETRDRMFNAGELHIAAVLAGAPNAVWVAEESPFRSLADLVMHARAENEKQHGVFILAGTGSYTDQHLASLEFDRAAGVKSRYLPVLGSAEAIQAVKDGSATACWGYALAPERMPGMRALAVAGERRSVALPEVPTFLEVRVDMINVTHFALAIRSDSLEEGMRRIQDGLAALMMDEVFRDRAAARGFVPLVLDRQEIDAFLEDLQRDVRLRLAEYELIPRHLRR